MSRDVHSRLFIIMKEMEPPQSPTIGQWLNKWEWLYTMGILCFNLKWRFRILFNGGNAKKLSKNTEYKNKYMYNHNSAKNKFYLKILEENASKC